MCVCVPCLCLDGCLFWAAYGYTSQGAQRSRFSAIYSCLTGETIRSADSTLPPDVLTVAASCNFPKRSSKGSGSQMHWGHLSPSKPVQRSKRRKKKKDLEAVSFLRLTSSSFLSCSFHLKLRDTHLSLITHPRSTHTKVLWICINGAYGAGTRCVQEGRVLPMHYSPFKLPE